MPTFRDDDLRDKELTELRLQLARLFGAAKEILATVEYLNETGSRVPIPRGQVARLRVAVEAIEEGGQQ